MIDDLSEFVTICCNMHIYVAFRNKAQRLRRLFGTTVWNRAMCRVCVEDKADLAQIATMCHTISNSDVSEDSWTVFNQLAPWWFRRIFRRCGDAANQIKLAAYVRDCSYDDRHGSPVVFLHLRHLGGCGRIAQGDMEVSAELRDSDFGYFHFMATKDAVNVSARQNTCRFCDKALGRMYGIQEAVPLATLLNIMPFDCNHTRPWPSNADQNAWRVLEVTRRVPTVRIPMVSSRAAWARSQGGPAAGKQLYILGLLIQCQELQVVD
ncbi:hypothetical protein BC832DRAFT_539555 [Gaertneriomyces semiglobifer]|nr:hypothetical protein BC832DRAFT_539555 [Gaertneriomyces semiglobifer]